MDYITGNNAADIIQYKITDAKWSLENNAEKTDMNDTNILLLDKMLDSKYS